MFDLAPQMPPVDWAKALTHLPEADIMKAVGGPTGSSPTDAEVPTGGAMIKRTPNDPAWYRGRPVARRHEDQRARASGSCPGTTCRSGRTSRRTTSCARRRRPEIANEQYAVIAPTLHCAYKRATEHTVVGERDMGDARLDYDALTYGWFDHFLKGEDNGILEKMPKVRYYTMGLNKWQTSDTWPPAGAQPMTLYLASGGQGEHAERRRRAGGRAAPDADTPDKFTYDPMNPVPSYGGNVCCTGNAVATAARSISARWKSGRTSWSTPPSR